MVAAASALGVVFFLLLWASNLEAEYLNLGTLIGRDEREPHFRVLPLGVALGALAALLAGLGYAIGRRTA